MCKQGQTNNIFKTRVRYYHKVKAKAKIIYDVCRLFFDLFRCRFRFPFMWIGP